MVLSFLGVAEFFGWMNFKISGEICQQKSAESLLKSPKLYLDHTGVDFHKLAKALTYIFASQSYLKSLIHDKVTKAFTSMILRWAKA